MKKMHDKIHSFASWFLPDMHHLPASAFAKNLLFFLGLFWFGTMFFGDVSANTNIATSLNNSVMTIERLRVTNNGLPSGTRVVELDTNGVKLNLGSSTWVLRRGAWDYITQWLVVGADIQNYTIDGTKIQNNAITDVKIASWSITNTKIQDGVITCEKLNLGTFPWLSCAGWPVPNGSCAPGEFLQGITASGGFICVPGGWSWSLPTCSAGQTVMYSGGTWTCVTTTQGAGGGSYWDFNWISEDIRNNNAGNVGIWTNSPSSKLTVSGSVLVQGNDTTFCGWFTAVACTRPWETCHLFDPMLSDSQWVCVTSTSWTQTTLADDVSTSTLYVRNGKVGILTNNPQYALDVVGVIRAGQVLTLSDMRLKTNIKAINNALTSLLGINGYSYTLKANGEKQYGLLAQEVEQFFPYVVSTDANGFKAVNYNWLIAPIIQAIHELDTKVQWIEAKYQSNENRIKALEAKLAK